MTGTHSVSDLKAMLNAVRVQIELLDGVAKNGSDNKLRKRIEKLKGEPITSSTTPTSKPSIAGVKLFRTMEAG